MRSTAGVTADANANEAEAEVTMLAGDEKMTAVAAWAYKGEYNNDTVGTIAETFGTHTNPDGSSTNW